MSLLIQHELKVRPNSEAEFLRIARALAASTKAEPGTLRYDWYVTPKAGHYAILEEYVDADAAQTHNNHVEPLLRELFAVVDLVSSAFYGELNQYIRDWISGRDGITVNKRLV
jgi:quinol monooxygenase YgiN